jgi:hypothetical protein
MREEYAADVAACKQHLQNHGKPVEFFGSAGDVA